MLNILQKAFSGAKAKVAVIVGAVALGATNAMALPLVLPSIDAGMGDVTAWFTIILGGLAIIWGYRKVTNTTNKT